ncbi:MAG: hypothetical protein F6K25_07365 [Okeania sp. SIO2G4]|uniref:hypothetical protein n=1 Tax=unclassified Okeania TaxID=2634635 RepID=UPI0013B71025|nr:MULTISPECIES: hypothetical protein [unclassified Okeania]NEP72266.1 hypothetical protein [Okeania sp. SIO2G5]NEP94587.1 hypothetical protein [Okeania sp. SIO2F5]NEQ90545.1 hypothetical protein [Okeania sp. SIO2G4]
MRTDRQLKTQTTLFQLSVISHQFSVVRFLLLPSTLKKESGVRSQESGGKIAWG